jgi:exodeoxyribonuclease VII small subunit
MESNYTYIDAFNELQQIVADIEIGDVNVDELASKIKKASELISVCKAKLVASEEEVERLLSQLSTEEPIEEDE